MVLEPTPVIEKHEFLTGLQVKPTLNKHWIPVGGKGVKVI